MSELLFVVEASHSSGIGHLMRCLALAQAAEERGLNSVFFVPEYAKNVCKARHDWCGGIIIAEPNDDATVAQIKEKIATQNAVALILDGYHFSDQFVSQLALLPVPLVLDSNACVPIPVLSPTVAAAKALYPKAVPLFPVVIEPSAL